MAHEPHCNCCGCSRFDILRPGFYTADVLNTTGKLVDFPASTPTAVTVVSATWSIQSNGLGSFWAGRGTSKFDLSASSISVPLQYFPLLQSGGGFGVTYQASSPPSGQQLTSTATVSLYDSVEGSATMSLIGRTDAPVYGIGPQLVANFDPTPYMAQNYTGLGAPPTSIGGGDLGYTQYSFTNLPEPAYTGTGGFWPALPGTPLSTFTSTTIAGAQDLRSYSENARLVWYCTPNVPGTPQQGFDLKQSAALGETSLLVFGTASRLSLQCLATEVEDDLPTEGFFTAWVNRGNFIPVSAGSPNYAVAVSPSHRTVTMYRNGQQVFFGHNPTAAQIAQSQSEDGVYFVVTEVDERSLSPWNQPHKDTRRHDARMLKDYSAFVVDSVPPVIGFTPPDDVYWEDVARQFPVGRMLSTEPLITYPQWQSTVDQDPSSPITRPMGPFVFSSTTGATACNASGTYTLRLFRRTDHFDIGGNYPAKAPTVQWTAHQKPEDDHLGATPKLEDPGLLTREYFRPRLASEPVASLLLTFDRKVNASQVDASQLTLTKDGESVEGCEIDPVDDSGQLFRVTIPVADQTPRSFLLLTYDPSGVVFTNEAIPVLRFGSRDEFPTVGKTKTVYVHPDANGVDVRFSYGRELGVQSGPRKYVQLGTDDPPIDSRGYPYAPEPCRLATRVGWLMADMDGYPRSIDTSSTQGAYQIGRVASISETKSLDHEKDKSKVGVTQGLYLPLQNDPFGQFSPLLNYEGYTPSVPSRTSPESDCSYFGLSTTIDPCPPANVSSCAAPRVAQKHASAIRCDGDIDSVEISLVSFKEDGQPFDFSTVPPFVTGGNGFSVDSDGFAAAQAAALLMAKSGQPYTFGKTLDGDTLSQNVWACVDGARQVNLQIQERRTRQPDGTCPTWTEPLYSVGITPGEAYTPEEVEGWETKPGYQHIPVIRDNEVVTPEKYQPGDRWWAGGAFPSGLCFPWWVDRRNPATREDFEYSRGSSSGIVRKMTGTLKQDAVQGCLSAYRPHKTFPSLKTTTLGELCLAISLRMVIKADVSYEDIRLKAKYYTMGGITIDFVANPYHDKCGNFTFDQVMDAATVTAFGGTADQGGYQCDQAEFRDIRQWTEWSSLSEGESVSTKSVTHQFIADINDTVVLSKEQEETLAAGGEVFIKAGPPGAAIGPGISYWKIKKG